MNWAYIAGFFDGEGCVQITRDRRSSNNFRLRISIGQRYSSVLKELHEFVGYGYYYTHKIQKTFVVTREPDVQHFIKSIKKHSVVKTQQLDLALEFIKLKESLSIKQKLYYRSRLQKLKKELL